MLTIIEKEYTNRLNLFIAQLQVTEKKIKLISIIRLVTALFFILCFYFALTYSLTLFYLFFSLLAVFSILVIIHSHYFKKQQLLLNYIQINNEELNALKGDHKSFDKGEEYIDHDHGYSYDLDIFGNNSLFQFLCRTVTYNGKNKLAVSITETPDSIQFIKTKQESIKELKDNLNYRQKFRALGLQLQESKEEKLQLTSWLEEKTNFIQHTYLKILLYILPFTTLISLVYAIYQLEWNIVLTTSLLVNSVIYGGFAKKINQLHHIVSKKKIILETYSELIAVIETQKFESPLLQSIHQQLTEASAQFKLLANYTGWLDHRLNILFSPTVNLLFLYDLHWCIAIEKWKERNKTKIVSWIDSVGEADTLNSLANTAYNNPHFHFPEFSDELQPLLQAKGISHPLLSYSKAIVNDFRIGIDDKSVIITGANMAGKSTFLRTLGVNLALAYSGAPVSAEYFRVSIMKLLSTMRISDSLKDHTSYFYAELQRLKFIKENLKSGTKCMVLLDEMLKGTNSNDKQKGSKAFVESLLNYSLLSIVATHDLELGKLEEEYPKQVTNYCFESYLNNNQLSFDYKIKNGMAQNTNASFLMKDLGII